MDDDNKILPEGFIIDPSPEGFNPDENILVLDTEDLPVGFVIEEKKDQAKEDTKTLLEIVRGPGGLDGPIGPTGRDGAIGPRGPIGPVGPDGKEGRLGKTGSQGSRGNIGARGIPGPIGGSGPEGKIGPDGKEGPPLEWEFCEVDGISDGGLRLRQTNGEWSPCKRIVGNKGSEGKDGEPGIAERAYGAGHGGGGGGGKNPLTAVHRIIAPGATEIVGSLPEGNLLAAKWFLNVIENVTNNTHAIEVYSTKKNTNVTWNKSSRVGDLIKYTVNLKIQGTQYILEITNNESNPIQVDGIVLPIEL